MIKANSTVNLNVNNIMNVTVFRRQAIALNSRIISCHISDKLSLICPATLPAILYFIEVNSPVLIALNLVDVSHHEVETIYSGVQDL